MKCWIGSPITLRAPMKARLLLILTVLFLNTCGVKRQVKVPQPISVVSREQWGAIETEPGSFMLFARSNQAMVDAVKEMCDKRKWICFGPDSIGEVFTFRRIEK